VSDPRITADADWMRDAPDGGYGYEHRRASRLRDWHLKAAVQTVLSVVPGGTAMNYALQRHVTRTLPVSDSELAAQVGKARRNIVPFERWRHKAIGKLHLFEFGAGWDLLMPLVYYAMGVQHQTVIDLHPLARLDLVTDVAQRLSREAHRFGLARPPSLSSSNRDVASLLRTFGIDYRAPADARHTGLPDGSVDLVTSTDVMEHVPVADILPILSECRRILAADGLMRVRIDYQDHYWYFDANLTPYNFLRFSPDRWRRFNPGLHHQNRLRHPEFLSLIEQSGLSIIEDDHPDPSGQDLAMLKRVPLSAAYRAMPAADVAVRYANLTLARSSEDVADD
jgi:SAM-dependent methyltransferase